MRNVSCVGLQQKQKQQQKQQKQKQQQKQQKKTKNIRYATSLAYGCARAVVAHVCTWVG